MVKVPEPQGKARAATACVLATGAMLVAAGCSTSPQTLEDATKNKPGVIAVEVLENEGDDDFPFTKIPKQVTVVMKAEASTTQILAVFDAYEGDVEDGEVEGIELVLRGPKHATLATGEGVAVTRSMVRDLVEAQHQNDITEYRREAYPVLPSVTLTLATAGFDGVVEVADRYRDDPGLESVSVASGDFALIRDDVNGDPALADARQRFAQRANLRFGLTGALVTGRGALRLAATPGERAALRHYVRKNASQALGRVVVRAQALP